MNADPKFLYFKLAPYIVIYAEVLLILQYIFGLSLTQDELPDEKFAIIRQLGFCNQRGFNSILFPGDLWSSTTEL